MITFKQFINSIVTESFVNIFPHDEEKQNTHINALHDLVHKAYAADGGIRGADFESPESMKKIPMIKMNRKDGVINAAAFYKGGSGGRKRVAIATNGTEEGKSALANIMTSDLKTDRSYGESSKRSLSFLHKHMHADDVLKFAIHPDTIKKLRPNDEFRDVPHDDTHLSKYPHLKNHFYQRKIGGAWETKVALGTIGNEIK